MSDRTRKLTAGMAAGESAAVDEFYRTYFDWLYAQARHVGARDESFCLDVVQDAVLRIVRCVRTVDSRSQFEAWMKLVVKTAAYDLLRAEQRQTRHLKQAAMLREESTPTDTDQLEWLSQELMKLDSRLVKLIELRYREGWTLRRLAEHLGLSVATVDGRLRRALEQMKRHGMEKE